MNVLLKEFIILNNFLLLIFIIIYKHFIMYIKLYILLQDNFIIN